MTIDTKELRRLLERATPGPWYEDGDEIRSDSEMGRMPYVPTNRALIVAMRNALPGLLDEVERLRDEAGGWLEAQDEIEQARDDAEIAADDLRAENERLRERLQFDPGGSDKIDELEQALQFTQAENERLRTEVSGIPQLDAWRNAIEAERDALRAENELLKGPAPTAWAYERACEALNKSRADNERLRSGLEAAACALLDRCDCQEDCTCIPPESSAALAGKDGGK
jgi:chromosome segregation ATPase